MTINRIRKKRKNQFTQISNCLLQDERISYKAKGILAYLLSKPDKWEIVIKDICNHGKENESAIRTAFHELKEFGYMKWERVQGGWDYFIMDEPYKITKKKKNENNKKFIKPSIKDIKEYCDEIEANIDCNEFFNFYESKGWKVGRNPMKDWKASVRLWKSRNKGNLKQRTNNYNNKGGTYDYGQDGKF